MTSAKHRNYAPARTLKSLPESVCEDVSPKRYSPDQMGAKTTVQVRVAELAENILDLLVFRPLAMLDVNLCQFSY
jgi:hypothetical protein